MCSVSAVKVLKDCMHFSVLLLLPFQLVMKRLGLGMSARGKSGNSSKRYLSTSVCISPAAHYSTPDCTTVSPECSEQATLLLCALLSKDLSGTLE